MIDANSQMTSITAFAAAVNDHADATVAERMEPQGPLPWNESDASERNFEPSEAVPHSGSAAKTVEDWLAFGPFRLCPSQRLLFEGGRPLRLGSRAFEILIALLERDGEVISKRDLIARAWGSVSVAEANLKTQVAALRRTLHDDQTGSRYIYTVTARGYCFVAPVRRFAGSIDYALTARPAISGEAPSLIAYGCGHSSEPLLHLRHRHLVRVASTWRQACRSWRSAASESVFDRIAEESLPDSRYSLTPDET
jgi:DNA-binding winged helix-turn-helix (wHTH) protein